MKKYDSWIIDIAENTLKLYNKRKVVIWGDYEVSYQIKELIKENYNIDTAFFVDNDNNKIDERDVYNPDILDGKSSEYFVVVPVNFYQSLKDKLIKFGYCQNDYYYFCDCIVKQTDDYYENTHGNKIFGYYKNIKICFSGFNSTVKINESVKSDKNEPLSIFIHDNSEISIGEHSIINGVIHLSNDVKLNIGKYCNLSFKQSFLRGCLCIGEYCILNFKSIVIGTDGFVNIGKNTTCGSMAFIVPETTKITIGNDCMLSWNILFISNDAHTIFDVKTGKNINSTEEISKSRNIKIGNHIWIGINSTILYNTEINDGSIIGANSLVKGKFPNNCMIAGNPAKIIKKDVAWCRDNCSENILDCGEEYVNLTEDIF